MRKSRDPEMPRERDGPLQWYTGLGEITWMSHSQLECVPIHYKILRPRSNTPINT